MIRQMLSDTVSFRRDPLTFLVERAQTATEPLVPLPIGFRPTYLLTDPEYIKPLLKMSEDKVDKGAMMKKLREITGDNIVLSEGEDHARRRAAYHSVVARTAVGRLAPALAAEIRRTLAEVVDAGPCDAGQLGATVALRMISVVAFGANALSPDDEAAVAEHLRQVLSDLGKRIFDPFQAPWTALAQRRRIERSRKKMQMIVRRAHTRAPGSPAHRALGELQLPERETADELLTLLLTGHDKVGAIAGWLCYAMTTIPGLADQIAAEAVAVRDGNGEIDATKLSAARTTTAAIQEMMRLYPPAYWFGRGIRQDVEFGGRKLRRGTAIVISPWMFHRCPRFWEAPDEFRLDRPFTSKAFIPFGSGPRACVGGGLAMLELQLFALEVASAFRLTLVGEVGAPLLGVHLTPAAVPIEIRSRAAPASPAETAKTLQMHGGHNDR